MTTPTADKLRTYYASRYLSDDDDLLTEQTADAGGSTRTIIDAALTEAEGYWNGAVGWFDADTTTTALQGAVFHVQTFSAATDTLTLAQALPAAPAAGDTYRLVLGGKWRSSQETFGMAVGGTMPEFDPVVCTTVTGVTVQRASARLGEDDIYIDFDATAETLTLTVGAAGDPGVALDVSGDVSDGVLFAADDAGYLIVDVTNGSLPAGNEQEVLTLTYPAGYFIPDFEGYETSGGGKLRFRLEVAKNTDGSNLMTDLAVHAVAPAGTDTTIAAGESLTTAAGNFQATDLDDWPERSFWVRNTTVNAGAGDCRYVKYRSGNTLYCAAANDWTKLAFDAGVTEINVGDTVTGATSGATGLVVGVQLNSGSWAGSDAAGYLYLSTVTDDFDNDENLQVSAATVAVANGADVKGLRDYTATAWTAADDIEVMPDVDIAVEAPSTSEFEDPEGEGTIPAGMTFTAPDNEPDAVAIGDLAAGAIYGVWRREWIMDSHRARAEVVGDTTYFWA